MYDNVLLPRNCIFKKSMSAVANHRDGKGSRKRRSLQGQHQEPPPHRYDDCFTISSTIHFFFLLIGAHSAIFTVSPNEHTSCSSCAINFFLCFLAVFIRAFTSNRSTRTTTVFCIAVDTTLPIKAGMLFSLRTLPQTKSCKPYDRAIIIITQNNVPLLL